MTVIKKYSIKNVLGCSKTYSNSGGFVGIDQLTSKSKLWIHEKLDPKNVYRYWRLTEDDLTYSRSQKQIFEFRFNKERLRFGDKLIFIVSKRSIHSIILKYFRGETVKFYNKKIKIITKFWGNTKCSYTGLSLNKIFMLI